MDWKLFNDILSIESTSGKERELAEYLLGVLSADSVEKFEVGDGTLNLLLKWGEPKLVFCTHMDTVPPYIAPEEQEDRFTGRGSCDAKGQLFSMYSACQELAAEGKTDFGLLLLSGEETGSWGAKNFANNPFKAKYLLIGEPTGNKMVSAAKGTKSYKLKFEGKAFHSGYPEMGASAVDAFVDFVEELRAQEWPLDDKLGLTTYNIGQLRSDNPQNILSGELSCNLYFRTTFASDAKVVDFMKKERPGLSVVPRGGDVPTNYMVVEGLESAPVAFGSDAPHLSNFENKMICGPGTIMVAHRDEEYILKDDILRAVEIYKSIYSKLI